MDLNRVQFRQVAGAQLYESAKSHGMSTLYGMNAGPPTGKTPDQQAYTNIADRYSQRSREKRGGGLKAETFHMSAETHGALERFKN